MPPPFEGERRSGAKREWRRQKKRKKFVQVESREAGERMKIARNFFSLLNFRAFARGARLFLPQKREKSSKRRSFLCVYFRRQ
jgi:hypothetical protein